MQVDSPAKTHTLVIEKDAARKEFERLVRGLVDFHEQERGKTVYIAIQWQNEKGEKGPFSAIQSAIVP
jgi:hypothetical protein